MKSKIHEYHKRKNTRMSKTSVLLSAILFVSINSFAQPSPIASENGPQFKWEKTVYEFGEIAQSVPATAEYKFTNTGNEPIIITQVKKTCGCTVPTWPTAPIMPGEEATIKATYNAKSTGSFTKTITVVSNVSENSTYLQLKGTVIPAETNTQSNGS